MSRRIPGDFQKISPKPTPAPIPGVAYPAAPALDEGGINQVNFIQSLRPPKLGGGGKAPAWQGATKKGKTPRI